MPVNFTMEINTSFAFRGKQGLNSLRSAAYSILSLSKITTCTYLCMYLHKDYISICILTPLSCFSCLTFHLDSFCLTATVKQPTMRLT